MTNEEFKVLEMAEKLLAEIQHDPLLQMQERRADIRRSIRDYFSCEERGRVISQHRNQDLRCPRCHSFNENNSVEPVSCNDPWHKEWIC